jgi:hypothetical protein
MAASKEVATPQGSAVEKVDAFFADIDLNEGEDPIEVQARIMAQILDAPTLDDAFNSGDTLSAEDLIDVPLEIDRVSWQRSSYKAGLQYFAVAFGQRLDEGLPVIFTTGAGNIVALLRRCQLHDEFPVQFKMVRAEQESEDGNRPIRFTRIGDRATPAA